MDRDIYIALFSLLKVNFTMSMQILECVNDGLADMEEWRKSYEMVNKNIDLTLNMLADTPSASYKD